MLYAEKMAGRKENITLLLLMLVGVIIVPVLLIWTADNLFALTIKTFLAVFSLLLLIQALPGKRKESGFGRPEGGGGDT
jgi:uncharacterized membrane protein